MMTWRTFEGTIKTRPEQSLSRHNSWRMMMMMMMMINTCIFLVSVSWYYLIFASLFSLSHPLRLKSSLFAHLRHNFYRHSSMAKTVYQVTSSILNVKWNKLFHIWPKRILQSAGKLHAQTSWGDTRAHNKDLFSSNYISEMDSCKATDGQIGSEYGWKSSKITEVFWKMLYFVPIYSLCSNIQGETQKF